MIIDIILAVAAVIALVMGWRRGFIVQLVQLVAIYLAILLAPEFAGRVGAYIFQDPGLAYIAGFAIIIFAAWLIVWIIAPLLRYILFWDALKKIDSLLGMLLSLVALLIIASVGCSMFNTANIGDIRAEKLLELGAQGLSDEEVESYVQKLNDKDASMRDCFESEYLDFELLDESVLFYPLVSVGDVLCPGLKEFKTEMTAWTINLAKKNGAIY